MLCNEKWYCLPKALYRTASGMWKAIPRQDFPHTVIFFPVNNPAFAPLEALFFPQGFNPPAAPESWAVPMSWRVTGASYICNYSGNSRTSLWLKAAQEGLGYLAGEFPCWCGASWSANPPRCQILHPPGFLCQSHHYLVKNKASWLISPKATPSPEQQLDTGDCSSSTFAQAQEELRIPAESAGSAGEPREMANIHIPRRNPSAWESQSSTHWKQEPWDNPRLWHKGAV